jgi:hypothetical protein
MSAKHIAKELIQKFNLLDDESHSYHYVHNSKQCAIIAVDQILEIIDSNYDFEFWKEVKLELEKL